MAGPQRLLPAFPMYLKLDLQVVRTIHHKQTLLESAHTSSWLRVRQMVWRTTSPAAAERSVAIAAIIRITCVHIKLGAVLR